MNKLSLKLGSLFFLIIFTLETFMFFFLHTSLVDSRIEEELTALQARGNSHRNVLERHFELDTIHHVILMESEAVTDVVITDSGGKILNSSNNSDFFTKYLTNPNPSIPRNGRILEGNWKDKPFLVAVSPVQDNGQTIGYVYMFLNTHSVQAQIEQLNAHFLLTGLIAICLTVVIIIFLSNALTKPLMKMKEATSQINQGNFSVSLPKTNNDELGDLSSSIQILANDLNYLKQERNDFLASISHELRTPLTYIKGYTDILLKRSLPKDDQEKYLRIIQEETNRLSNLVEDLFELAKFDKNSFEITKQPIDLHSFLNGIEQKLSPAFREKQMKLQLNSPPGIHLYADTLRLEQILFNLLDNSIKYSPVGTRTLLTVIEKKQLISIIIEDNGKGIPEKDIPFIFNRFYRVDKSRTRASGGTGLGLAIVQELVLAHGGSISVESKVGAGTKFTITFRGDE
ncbi:sensor histidine kinase [Mesobacillus harenae]|uniref:sensor histidine kinase n=1 Tax=Mesobacillus harenae TaxID=2213203 RepID=UPI00157FD51B|nr:ATP-binding protein [Mesobacillus harenae]